MFPSGVKRQLFTLTLLLGIVLLLCYRVMVGLGRLDDGESAVPRTASSGAEFDLDTGLEPVDVVPPEPYEETAEVLAELAARDRTSELNSAATARVFQKLLTRGDVSESSPALSLLARDDVWASLVDSPDAYRGQLVEVSGFVVQPEGDASPLLLRGLPFPNPSGRDRMFRSYLYGTDDRYYIVATLTPQPSLRHREGVVLRGYFCHLYTHQVEVDGQIRDGTVPFLVGSEYHVVSDSAVERSDWTMYLPAIVLLPMVALALAYFLNWRAQKNFDARRQAARELQRKSGGQE